MSESEYLTVSQYAALIGVSEKTARKRISRGDVEAERVALSGGGWSWHVYPDRLEAVGNRLETPFESETGQKIAPVGSAPVAVGSVPTAKVPSVPSDTTAALLAEKDARINDLRTQVDAWRLQAEAANRTAAETSAALRKALEAMPKAITEGAKLGQVGTENQTPIEATQEPLTTNASQTAADGKQSPNRGAQARKLTAWQRVAARILGIR